MEQQMQDTLNRQHHKREAAKLTGAPLTGFGALPPATPTTKPAERFTSMQQLGSAKVLLTFTRERGDVVVRSAHINGEEVDADYFDSDVVSEWRESIAKECAAEDDEPGICGSCSGSGEGQHEGQVCWACRGCGES
jgi:hypothetical protein